MHIKSYAEPIIGEGDTHVSRRGILRSAALLATGGAAASLGGLAPAVAKPPPFETQFLPNYFPKPDHVSEIDLTGKVAVITGASRGIGLATGLALQNAGVTVLGTSRDPAAHPLHPFPLLSLDLEDPLSINAFLGAVQTHSDVVNNGGIDILVNNAGRFAVGTILPVDPGTYFPAIEKALAVLYGGHIAVTSGLFQSLAIKAATTQYARIVFTTSVSAYAVGGTEPGTSFNHSYTSGKRALLAYANSLRGIINAAGFGVGVSTVNPYFVNTDLATGLNPIYTQPVDGSGNAIGDPNFQLFLDQSRLSLANGLPPAFAAEAFLQLLTSQNPDPNVAVASEEEPFATQAQVEFVDSVVFAEMNEAAASFGCAPPGRW
jgi:NAD(P)-dependent dehydrogenase (short-subunit alcohol dehydrogenase family)